MTRVPIRLGEDVFNLGYISKDKIIDLENAMMGFSSLMKAYRVTKFRACATSAMRDASNGKEVLDRIKKIADIDIKIIDGKLEAEYIFNAGIEKFLKEGKNYLYIDVGGGSTELSLLINGARKASASFKFGTVRMLNNGWHKEEWARMKDWLAEHVQDISIESAIGSGGNINRYYKLSAGKNNLLDVEDLNKLYNKLQKLDYKERIKEYNLKYDRADVIVPAGKIFLKIIEKIAVKQVIIPKLGLADGVINQMLENN